MDRLYRKDYPGDTSALCTYHWLDEDLHLPDVLAPVPFQGQQMVQLRSNRGSHRVGYRLSAGYGFPVLVSVEQ